MTTAQKERPKGAPTPKGPDIKLVHALEKADMSSVPQAGRPTIERAELNRQTDRLGLIAGQGMAIANILADQDVIESTSPKLLQQAIYDLAMKFEQIESGLDAL